jgi:hypothetical protein
VNPTGENIMRKSALVLASLAVLSLGACSVSGADVPDPTSVKSAEDVREVIMPLGYNDYTAVCDGPNMVYVFDGSGGAVVPNDPRCAS